MTIDQTEFRPAPFEVSFDGESEPIGAEAEAGSVLEAAEVPVEGRINGEVVEFPLGRLGDTAVTRLIDFCRAKGDPTVDHAEELRCAGEARAAYLSLGKQARLQAKRAYEADLKKRREEAAERMKDFSRRVWGL